ncbi:SDR family oxidoreductase [Kitasatospora sp. NPDC059571]|uniref:SDR family oxidoreductase n=1 Tax=Kitasatospora sp. NPDC059571 TaxID=3346871 RepID=UPI003684FE81
MIVVTGATGNVGRSLVRRLHEAGEAVTAVARHITDADVPAGVRAVAADLAEPQSLESALHGADALFLLVAGDDPGGITARARAAGVRKVVLLSSQGVGTRPRAYRHAAGFEAAVAASGLDWTVLRSGGLASNAFAWVGPVRASGVAPAPFGDVGLPFVDPDDVAAAAAVVLRGDGHRGATYVLTGPEPTTPRQRAAALAEALGTPVRFEEQSRQEAHEQLARLMPVPVVEGTLDVLGEPTEEEQRVGADLPGLLGRPATPFADWARRNAPAFR